MTDPKGEAKETAGKATGGDDLKREGQADKAADKAKEGVDKVTDKVQDALRTTAQRG